jgi:SAM-dependent methyltransferase
VSAPPRRCIVCGDEATPRLRRGGLAVVRSPGCGLEWREPPPGAAELAALYAPGYLGRWGLRDADDLERVRAMKRRTYEAILDPVTRLRSGGRLLDVGCAAGFLLESAAERGFEAWGVDPNPEAVALARRRHGDRVRLGSLEEGAFEAERFDVVTLVDVFEHVLDPSALLAEVRRRLVPGGILAAVMPNAASGMRRLLGRRWPHYAPEHVYYWTPSSLGRFLSDRGWELRLLRTGFRKRFTARYLGSYAACVGSWLPPGLTLLGDLGFTVPTGEMLVLAAARRLPAEDGSPAAPAAASDTPE